MAGEVGQYINLDKNLAAESHRSILVRILYWVVMGVEMVVVMVVVVVEAMMMVLFVVVSNVQSCDLVRIECSNYLHMQLLEKHFFRGIE